MDQPALERRLSPILEQYVAALMPATRTGWLTDTSYAFDLPPGGENTVLVCLGDMIFLPGRRRVDHLLCALNSEFPP